MNVIKYTDGIKLKSGNIYQTNEGNYRLIDNKLYTAVAKISEYKPEIKLKESLGEIKLPLIPNELFEKIKHFFQEVYKKHKSEVAILLWYNFEIEDWKIEVPKQTVSGSSVNYNRDKEISDTLTNDGYVCVGSIHSHCEMGAFHSGTDDSDEYQFDGLHITIGKVISKPEYACRFIIKNTAYTLKFEECVETKELDNVQLKDWMEQVNKPTYKNSTLPNSLYNYKGLYDYRFSSDTSKDLILCPICNSKSRANKIMCTGCSYPFDEDPEIYQDYLYFLSNNKLENTPKLFNKWLDDNYEDIEEEDLR